MNLPTDTRYSDAVWQRFRHPRYAGRLGGPGARTVELRTPGSRAVLRLDLRLQEDRIQQARFLAYGCVATVATADWLAGALEGKTIAEAEGLSAEAIVAALDLPAVKRHCALLALDALKAALRDNSA